jgi:hypothetical protein
MLTTLPLALQLRQHARPYGYPGVVAHRFTSRVGRACCLCPTLRGFNNSLALAFLLRAGMETIPLDWYAIWPSLHRKPLCRATLCCHPRYFITVAVHLNSGCRETLPDLHLSIFMSCTGIFAMQYRRAKTPGGTYFLPRDGVCHPVTHVLPMVTFLNHAETLRTGQHAPSGLKPGRVGTCCSCPRGMNGTLSDNCTKRNNHLKMVGKKTCPPYPAIGVRTADECHQCSFPKPD